MSVDWGRPQVRFAPPGVPALPVQTHIPMASRAAPAHSTIGRAQLTVSLVVLLILVGCTARPISDLAPVAPLDGSPQATWTYAAQLLGRGDAAGALTSLETIDAGSLTPGRQR